MYARLTKRKKKKKEKSRHHTRLYNGIILFFFLLHVRNGRKSKYTDFSLSRSLNFPKKNIRFRVAIVKQLYESLHDDLKEKQNNLFKLFSKFKFPRKWYKRTIYLLAHLTVTHAYCRARRQVTAYIKFAREFKIQKFRILGTSTLLGEATV